MLRLAAQVVALQSANAALSEALVSAREQLEGSEAERQLAAVRLWQRCCSALVAHQARALAGHAAQLCVCTTCMPRRGCVCCVQLTPLHALHALRTCLRAGARRGLSAEACTGRIHSSRGAGVS